jgi:hypothetical protein
MRVVLPAPFGPSSPMARPDNERVRSRKIGRLPNSTPRLSSSITEVIELSQRSLVIRESDAGVWTSPTVRMGLAGLVPPLGERPHCLSRNTVSLFSP